MKYVDYIKEYKSSFNQMKNAFYFNLYSSFNNVSITEKVVNKITMLLNEAIFFPNKEYVKLEIESKKLVDEFNF